MKHVVFAVPGSLDTPTGGYAYDRRIIAELRQLGWDVECLDIGEGFPSPDEATRSAARSLLLKVPDGQPIVLDGLALGVLPDVVAEVASRHPLLALVHHPLALEWGLSAERADVLRRSEQAALAAVREVVVTSPATAKLVAADYGVPMRSTSRWQGPAAILRRGLQEAEAKFRICCPLAPSCPAKDLTCSLPHSRDWLNFRGG